MEAQLGALNHIVDDVEKRCCFRALFHHAVDRGSCGASPADSVKQFAMDFLEIVAARAKHDETSSMKESV